MPASIKNRRAKLIASKLTLEMMRGYAVVFVGEPFGSRAVDSLLITAAFIGHAEGRQMKASKIAEYAGVPRPSAIRRLKLLETNGLIIKQKDGTYRVPTARQNDPTIRASTAKIVRSVINAGRALSKLDT